MSAGLRSGTCSLRSRPSTRTRGADPTLQCRSEPPVLARACRNGITDCVGWLTHWISDVGGPALEGTRDVGPWSESGEQHGRRPPYVDEGRSHEQARPQAPFPQGQRSEPRQPSQRLSVRRQVVRRPGAAAAAPGLRQSRLSPRVTRMTVSCSWILSRRPSGAASWQPRRTRVFTTTSTSYSSRQPWHSARCARTVSASTRAQLGVQVLPQPVQRVGAVVAAVAGGSGQRVCVVHSLIVRPPVRWGPPPTRPRPRA